MLTGCFQYAGYAQGTLIYLNGKEKRFSSAELKGEYIVYKPEKTDKGEQGIKKADKYNVFSILKDDGTEEVIYNPDTSFEDEPTVAEIRDYIKGEKYAAVQYNKPANFVTSMQIGFISGILLPPFYGIAAPIIYPGVLGLFPPKVKTPLTYQYDEKTRTYSAISGPEAGEKVVSDSFAAGYGRKARNIKMKHGLIGGAIGFSISATAMLLLLGN